MAGRSAPYGQACLSCFKTKCKCVLRSDGNGCERCYRLKRPCHPADAIRRRSDKKQNSSDARIAKLEGTLDQLVSLLSVDNTRGDRVNIWSHQQSPPIVPYPDVVAEGIEGSATVKGPAPAFINEENDTDTDAVGDSTSWWAMNNANEFSANGISVTTSSSLTGSGAFESPSVPRPSLSPPPASVSIDIFCSRMLHHFPFFHFPAHLTAEQLQLDRPFLFRAIICVTSASVEGNKASSLELKRVLCETAFLRQSQQNQQRPQHETVDLLLGLLVYIAWGWEHLRSRRSLSRLMGVATSLVGELRSHDQVIPDVSHTIRHLEPNGGYDDVYGVPIATTATTTTTTTASAGASDTHLYLERQRAILGCFVLGSALSAYFSQADAPRWTPQMDEGFAAIFSSGNSVGTKCSSDAALALQVRMQLLAMKAAQVWERAQLPDHPPPEALSRQALFYIKTLMGQVQELRASVPPACQQHFGLLAQTYYTEMCIIESVHLQDSIPSSPPRYGPTRISCFWQSALTIKSCVTTFLTLSPSGLLGVSFIQWAQLARCLATLHRLSTLQEPGWDPATVSRLVDLPVLLSYTADKLELAAAEAGEQLGSVDGVFTQLARGLRMFQSAYHDSVPLPQREEAHRAKEAGTRAGIIPDVTEATAPITEAYTDALAYTQQAGPTLWLDQFFVDYDDQMLSTL
ncbi:uncharacterized protein N7500_008066 [Penicillium coprophilum]|uniref:uncharacterized protein n=1 Tax=Penicillium coprophilum TaxID=36646 RepID=UPI00238EC7D1|nr:uncharacterized protein N7500_008066 [Penicillium coprophilum]KAJ5158415.1 hypothetical protein N7500_008066 [Penicillium coprophilum]